MDATQNGEPRTGSFLVLFTTCLATFVVGYNATAVITAAPAMKAEFDLDRVTLQWVMNAYMLAAASFVLVMGRLSDIFGKIRLFLIGITTFALASLALVIAQDTAMVMIARAAQGLGASSVFTNAVALLNVSAPPRDRPAAVGLWAGIATFGIGVGPLVGGGLTEAVGWRFVFATDVILLITALFLFWRLIKSGVISLQAEEHPEPIDYRGGVLLVLTLGSTAYMVSNGPSLGWSSPLILALVALALAGAVLFLVAERRTESPLVHLRFFRHRQYAAAAIGMFIMGFALLGGFYYLNLFFQARGGLDYSGIKAGAATLPMTATMVLLAVTLPRRLKRAHFRWAISLGMAAFVVGFGLLSLSGDRTDYADLWWKLVIVGAGFGLTYPLLPTVGLRVLPDEHAGQGAGVINTCMYFGACIGVAACGIAAGIAVDDDIAAVLRAVGEAPQDTASVAKTLIHGSAGQVKQVLAGFSAPDAAKIKTVLHGLEDDRFDAAALLLALSSAIGLVSSLTLIREDPDSDTPDR